MMALSDFEAIYGRTTPLPQPGPNATVGEWLAWDQDRAAAAFTAEKWAGTRPLNQPWVLGSSTAPVGTPSSMGTVTYQSPINLQAYSQEGIVALAKTPLSDLTASSSLPSWLLPVGLGLGLFAAARWLK